jgi:hypothetical protein
MNKVVYIFMNHGTGLSLNGDLLTPDQYNNKKYYDFQFNH